jgi:hypothetical protein
MFTLEDDTKVSKIPNNYTGVSCAVVGTKRWYLNGNLHRLDGPAIEWADGSKWWLQYGKCYRIDGPAVEDITKTEWWLFDKEITKIITLVIVTIVAMTSS